MCLCAQSVETHVLLERLACVLTWQELPERKPARWCDMSSRERVVEVERYQMVWLLALLLAVLPQKKPQLYSGSQADSLHWLWVYWACGRPMLQANRSRSVLTCSFLSSSWGQTRFFQVPLLFPFGWHSICITITGRFRKRFLATVDWCMEASHWWGKWPRA